MILFLQKQSRKHYYIFSQYIPPEFLEILFRAIWNLQGQFHLLSSSSSFFLFSFSKKGHRPTGWSWTWEIPLLKPKFPSKLSIAEPGCFHLKISIMSTHIRKKLRCDVPSVPNWEIILYSQTLNLHWIHLKSKNLSDYHCKISDDNPCCHLFFLLNVE